jgi:hypothetical protein
MGDDDLSSRFQNLGVGKDDSADSTAPRITLQTQRNKMFDDNGWKIPQYGEDESEIIMNVLNPDASTKALASAYDHRGFIEKSVMKGMVRWRAPAP